MEDRVHFPEDNPKLIARLILFLYTNHYPRIADGDEDDCKVAADRNERWFSSLRSLLNQSTDIFNLSFEDETLQTWDTDSMLVHALMHALADKFDVPNLLEQARRNYDQAAKCFQVGRVCFNDFAESVKIVYRTTGNDDRRLRDITLSAARVELEVMRNADTEEDPDEQNVLFRDLLLSTPEYAVELLITNLRKTPVKCQTCQDTDFQRNKCSCGLGDDCRDDYCGI